ncbi:BgTH12-03679 [Blumeria graminis f. sp. triticale]|uniref:BgtASP-20572 n=3 Tax=Blumeria graminis TaxID=34373 RepID=A0A9X9L8I6_BLUGR|nr:hypothetical protein BGT96224_ASP20572 [Blumeria graminis f. sp. tritici 96224]CAD6499568.1 BgTH12-03679 [Blumeria graminis f. sp. triticale]VCU39735.1 BgtASP-20572 [Blumeria graminis f. sp. tritici]
MSRASRLTLAGTSLFALTTVIFVHYAQGVEKAAMHQGVLRDVELQRIKKERLDDFNVQRALEHEYRKRQSVRDVDDYAEPRSSTSTT